ncbi:transcriptional regulator [Mucilaginibacter hurinus]|uniref:Transcriptional regulator n=1 Tax=Mucilaginibacter hurinus TaxID=2201324 RepID=A0A367GKP4_9SPHI|nr:helix-turn-helix transcriptional regulator [Mucilaginibacter hurinus]RCH54047.1 transcriptional regulator [Mucilaginibacter hurinus]
MTNTVKMERSRINLSQQDLAEKVNVSRQTIHSIESGKFMPSYILAVKIAKVFNMSPVELFVLEDGD